MLKTESGYIAPENEEYADELVDFTALSDSYFETASDVRYRFNEDATVFDYEESLRGE